MTDLDARMRQMIGSVTDWKAHDIPLEDGELGIERRPNGSPKLKVGDGVNNWSALEYMATLEVVGQVDITAPPPSGVEQGDMYEVLHDGVPHTNYGLPPAVVLPAGTLLLDDRGKWYAFANSDLVLAYMRHHAVAVSAGAADAGKIVLLDNHGLISNTMIDIPDIVTDAGPIDATAAPPANPVEDGFYINSKSGTLHNSFGIVGHPHISAGSLLFYDGAAWHVIAGIMHTEEWVKAHSADASTGAAEAGMIVLLDSKGHIDDSMLDLPAMVSASAGQTDHGKIPLLDTQGKLDTSFLSIAGGMQFKGGTDVTQPAPAGSHKAGEYYLIDVAGTADASWPGIAGDNLHKGDSIIYDGTNWHALAAIHDLDSLIAATEANSGIVRLATAAEVNAGTSVTRVPSVKRIVDWVKALHATTAAWGLTIMASASDMTTGTSTGRVPSVKVLIDYLKANYLTQTTGDGRYVRQTRQVKAGTGLTGGGALSTDRTISASFATTAQVQAGTDTTHLLNSALAKTAVETFAYSKTAADGRYALRGRTISAGSGLTGGGSLAANRTIAVSWASAAQSTSSTDKTHVMAPYNVHLALAAYTYSKSQADGRFAPKSHTHGYLTQSTADGRYILKSTHHISASGPSGGSAGDIWFKY